MRKITLKQGILKLGIFFLLMILIISCSKEKQSEKGKYFGEKFNSNKIILKVENSYYFNSDFEEYVKSIVGDMINNLNADVLSRLYDKFVDEMIFLEAAKMRGISLTWEEKRDYLAKINAHILNKSEKIVLSKTLLNRLVVEKYISLLIRDIKVEKNEIASYYRTHIREFRQPERLKVRQILVKSESKAIEILNKLKNSPPEKFIEIAKKESISPDAERGGDMGFYERGQLPEEMEKVIFSLKEGELSQVVQSDYGFHIFRVEKRERSQILPLDKVSKKIEIKLFQKKISEILKNHLEELKSKFNWITSTSNLPFPYSKEKE
ncbi:peptidyl-prolyl cis-trans isomerase [Candidatus Aminicenantes bacterium AH-873-B07]|nr:peptidyl-prolyl cis-trans isomerase [Candidatus Aminicenantes bacterium AH-873-B07]